MKSMIAAAALVLSSSVALAYPTVGDSATLVGTFTSATVSGAVSITQALTAYDAANGVWTVAVDQNVAGNAAHEDRQTAEDEVATTEYIQNVLANCASVSGTPESLTVPAGTFDTCKFVQADSEGSQTFWLADVPFGLAKSVEAGNDENGQPYTIEASLTAYVVGK